MAAPEIDSTDGIKIGNVLIHAGNVDGRDVSVDGATLDGLSAGGYPGAGEQAFLDADHDKLDGIEAGATTDQSNAEIRAAVEAATDSNVFTDSDHSKLDGTTKNVIVKAIPDDEDLVAGDGKTHFTIPLELNGMDLVSVGAHVYTVSSSGLPTFQIYNLTDSVDMLSTAITIDVSEKDSKDASTPAVINTSTDDVSTGDEIRFDCDTSGTGTKGMEIRLGFV